MADLELPPPESRARSGQHRQILSSRIEPLLWSHPSSRWYLYHPSRSPALERGLGRKMDAVGLGAQL